MVNIMRIGKWTVGSQITEDGKYVLLYITEGCDPVKRLFYCDLAVLPQGFEGFKGREEMLPFKKLIDNFEAEYTLVANDGALLVHLELLMSRMSRFMVDMCFIWTLWLMKLAEFQ